MYLYACCGANDAGELAPAVTATVNMTGHLVDFVVAHMGNDRDVLDRELQAKFLARELANALVDSLAFVVHPSVVLSMWAPGAV